MENEKSSKTLYQSAVEWMPRWPFGNRSENQQAGSENLAEQSEILAERSEALAQRKKRPLWVKLLRVMLVTALVLAVKVFFLGGWPLGYEYSFKVRDEPASVAEGTVCDLFRELEERQSSLLQAPGRTEKIVYQKDSIMEGQPESKMTIKVFQNNPTEEEKAAEAAVSRIDLDKLIHFEVLMHERARLVFSDGSCDEFDLGAVLRLLRDQDECHLFQAIADEGRVYEYFNIMYTESFEKIKCEEGTFYRARLNISKARCPTGNSLINCGTDLFSHHIYTKLRRRLEFLDPNNSYAFRGEYELYPCNCVGEVSWTGDPERAEVLEAAGEGDANVILLDGDLDLEEVMRGIRVDTVGGDME